MDTVFFDDTAQYLVVEAADVLLAENYSLVSTVPSEIADLTSKCYVVDVVVRGIPSEPWIFVSRSSNFNLREDIWSDEI